MMTVCVHVTQMANLKISINKCDMIHTCTISVIIMPQILYE